MRDVLVASLGLLLAACAFGPEPSEPAQPLTPDAGRTVDAAPTQTPQASTSVRAASFDQWCTRDDECVAIFEGNACQACRPANAAIRRDALPRYRAELGAFWACFEPTACTADLALTIGDPAICVANRCTLRGP